MKRSTFIGASAFIASGAVLAIPFLVFADDSFIPLTNLPGIASTSASAISLPSFVNNLYRIAIGVAAFFAVVEIVWAGYIFMTSADSVSKNTKARQKITNAIIGLVLVLSPYVVFSVINPKILNITLDFSGLQSKNGTGGNVTPVGATDNPGNQSGNGSGPATPSTCSAAGFTGIKAVADPPGCIALGGNYTDIAAGCCAGMAAGNVCCGDASNL